VLTVADTGSGIDAETRARMFEPFFSTKGFAGTGLGLWISAEIVQRHQGRLRVRSSQREGHRGTVISLFLPAEMG
jgi:signal transduction histidine kinase